MFTALGTPEETKVRIEWIKVQMEKQKRHNEMMGKVAESALIWAVIAFLMYLLYATGSPIYETLKFKGMIVK